MTGDLPPPPLPLLPPPLPVTVPEPARRRSTRPLLIAVVAAFALGLVAMALALPAIQRWRNPAAPAAPAAAAPSPVMSATSITPESLAAREAALDAQLRSIESRTAAADAVTRTAAGNAARAEALAITFAARRQLGRGVPLGAIESELASRFATEPGAVDAVIAAARQPVTLEDLRLALDGLAPRLTSGTAKEGIWPAIRRELGNLIVLRREPTPSSRPADRLTRARRLLDAGQVEGALAEVARLPGAPEAANWMDAAKRYIDARRGLDTLELAAIAGRAAPAAAAAPPNPAGQLPGP